MTKEKMTKIFTLGVTLLSIFTGNYILAALILANAYLASIIKPPTKNTDKKNVDITKLAFTTTNENAYRKFLQNRVAKSKLPVAIQESFSPAKEDFRFRSMALEMIRARKNLNPENVKSDIVKAEEKIDELTLRANKISN